MLSADNILRFAAGFSPVRHPRLAQFQLDDDCMTDDLIAHEASVADDRRNFLAESRQTEKSDRAFSLPVVRLMSIDFRVRCACIKLIEHEFNDVPIAALSDLHA